MTAAIRLATEDDAEQIQSIYAPFCGPDSHVSFEVEPPSVDEMRRRISSTMRRYPWLVVENRGAVLGYAYASVHNERAAYVWSVSTAIYIGDGQRGRGLGRALYMSLFSTLRLMGFVNAYAGATLPNEASVALHRAVGFTEVGIYRAVGYKAGAWRDVVWWQIGLRDHPSEPSPPKALPEMAGSRGWNEAVASGMPLLRY